MPGSDREFRRPSRFVVHELVAQALQQPKPLHRARAPGDGPDPSHFARAFDLVDRVRTLGLSISNAREAPVRGAFAKIFLTPRGKLFARYYASIPSDTGER